MEKVSVNIISSKPTAKGRMTEICMYISFGLLLLGYPINRLTGEGVLFQSIIAIIILNMFFWITYYYFFADKYYTLGEIIFDQDQLIIKEKNGLSTFKI